MKNLRTILSKSFDNHEVNEIVRRVSVLKDNGTKFAVIDRKVILSHARRETNALYYSYYRGHGDLLNTTTYSCMQRAYEDLEYHSL